LRDVDRKHWYLRGYCTGSLPLLEGLMTVLLQNVR
jgi:hypothetical protein